MHIGETQVRVDGYEGTYSGELNSKGEAFGEGTFTNVFGETYQGTFFWNKVEGLVQAQLETSTIVGEMKNSKWSGKRTRYSKDTIWNEVCSDGVPDTAQICQVHQPDDAWFKIAPN